MISIHQSVLIVSLAYGLVILSAGMVRGQNDPKTMMEKCVRSQVQEFQPLRSQRENVDAVFTGQRSAIKRILHWLKENPKTANAERLLEIAELEARLAVLKASENLTSVSTAQQAATNVRQTNRMLEEVDDQLNEATRPLQREFSQMAQSHRADEEKLKPIVRDLFYEKGRRWTAALERSFTSFNYSTGTGSATYRQPNESQSACVCYIYLVDNKPAREKYGLLEQRYPICYRSKTQLEIRVQSARVTISTGDAQFNGPALDQTLVNLVDLQKLESLIRSAGKR